MSADSRIFASRPETRSRSIERTVAFAAAFALIAFGAINLRVDSTYSDIWQHLAAIRFLATDLLAPPPLYLAEPYEVHLYTPYHVFWAAVMAAGRLDIWTVAAVSSVANLLFFMLGCRLVARRVIGNERMDFVLFATLLLFWGTPPWWSGVYSLAQIVLQTAYPSFFALSAAMILGALLFGSGFRAPPAQAGFAVALAALFVIHPITAGFLLVFLATAVATGREAGIRRAARAAATAAAGLGLGFLWPYFSVPELVLAARSSPDFFGGFGVFYDKPLAQIGPAVLGLVAATSFRKSGPIRFLSALLAALLIIYAVNYALHLSHILSRYLIFIAFTLQLLWVAWIAALPSPKAKAWALGLFAGVGLMAGAVQIHAGAARAYGPYWDLARGTPLGTHSAAQQYRDLEALGAAMTAPHASVMAPTAWAYPLAALTGATVAALPYDAPTIPNGAARRADAALFYAPAASCEARAEIARRRRADYVLVATGDPSARAIAGCAWRAVARDGRFVLYAAPGARRP